MAFRLRKSNAPITYALLAINVLIWIGQISPFGYLFTNQMFYAPLFTPFEPWRMLTAGFVHDWTSPFHILLNSYAIWIFGRLLEPMLGPIRYLVVYLTSIVGGSVAVLWLSNPQMPVVGASGGLFGLMGAYLIVMSKIGGNTSQIFALIAINLSMGFFVSGISWEGHLGGLATGLLMALAYTSNRDPKAWVSRGLAVLAVWGVLVIATLLRIESLF
jgi:membrane associated rhomboid family serine protease